VTVASTSDSMLEADGTFTLTLANATGATLTKATTTGTIVDDDMPGLKVSDAQVNEGSVLSFTVTLDIASSKPVIVSYSTADGKATAGSDYTAANSTLTFAAGEISKSVTVTTTEDSVVEADETPFLRLSRANGATMMDGEGQGTIIDGDVPGLKVSDVQAKEGLPLPFGVTLDTPSSKPVMVSYVTSNGTTTAGSDYAALNHSLAFAAGETSKMVTVTTTGDNTAEADETLFLRLSGANGATIVDGEGKGTIIPAAGATTS
jgi:hypothetical protein